MRIVLIGAGSYVFAPSVLNDAILEHSLSDCELVLVDINREMADLMGAVGRRMAEESGVEISLSSTDDRRAALPGADFVILSAAVEGARRWTVDRDILERVGTPDQARECAGIGGLSYALRSITLALGICREMEKLCPHAVLLDVTNPVPRVVTAVNKYTRIRAIGFCNVAWGGYPGYQRLAGMVGRRPDEIQVTTAGLNHFSWLVEIRDGRTGEELYGLVEERVREEGGLLCKWLREYGGIGVSGTGHMGEYLPFDADNSYRDRPPFHGDIEERRRRLKALRAMASGKADWRGLLAHRSWERPVDMAVALGRREDTDFDMVNIPNEGCLPQLPCGRTVEVPASVRRGELRGRPGLRLPEGVVGICKAVSDVHELVAEAAAKGERRLAERAVEIDPAVTDKTAAMRALDEILKAHSDILPQFN